MYKYSVDKMYSYNKGYAMALGMKNTVKAMAFARESHNGVERKNGEPYIVHPLTMVSHAISLGIAEDTLLASLMLHDVIEDCDISLEELPVSDEIKHIVNMVTYRKPKLDKYKLDAQTKYYNAIEGNRVASLVKIIDRCHNVSTMAGAFTAEKIDEYIEETERFIMPLIRKTKDNWPEMNNELFILKYHIDSVISSLKAIREMDKSHNRQK